MKEQTPKIFYKYLSIDRAIQVLQNQSIRFSQANFLNDAFELLPSLDIQRIKKGFIESSDTSNNLHGLDKFALGVTQFFLSEYESAGILCLSEEFDIPLMWAHYASNYSGIVVGFDISEGLTLDSASIPNSCNSAKVNYSKYRFKYPNLEPKPFDFMFHKDECWQYEKEWRIVRTLDTLINIGNDVYISKFNSKAVRCVIFGPLVEHASIHKVLEVLRNDEFSHVGRYISYLSDNKFEIDIEYLTSMFSDESEMIYSKEELRLRRFREKMLSKGELYKAMEVLDEKTKFATFKSQVNLYTGEIIKT